MYVGKYTIHIYTIYYDPLMKSEFYGMSANGFQRFPI